jgi:hypothetical protein
MRGPPMTFFSPSDLNLVALGVVIWVVALSVAFSFYIPVLRAEKARGARPTHRMLDGQTPKPDQRDGEDAPPPKDLSAGA